MVGVPISKGCGLCLKRSVKCDEVHPSCSQCRRGGRTCPGYARERKFVDEGPRLRRSRRQASDQRSRKLSDDDFNPTFSVSSVAEDSASHDKHYFQWKHQSHELKSFALERDQVLSSFVSAMFPLGVHSVQSSLLGSWLWHVPPRLGYSISLDYGALSLALVYFARVSEDELLFRSAEVSYTMALKSLAVDIAHPSKRLSSEVLCATLLLGHYETFTNTGQTWIRHAGGAARLMQLRGAWQCYESAFEYSMFLSCRGVIISEALSAREPCFLENREWRSIPDGLIMFPLLPKRPELLHAIFVYFAAVPGLLSRVSGVTDDTPNYRRRSILFSAYKLRQSFKQWFCEYACSGDEIDAPIIIEASPVLNESPFDSTLIYDSVISASIITTYYAYLILINHGINLLQPNYSHTEESLELGIAICKSVYYCSRSGYCGTSTLRFALPTAHAALPNMYHEWTGSWIEKVSGTLTSTMISRQ